jgi:hypothetical protein
MELKYFIKSSLLQIMEAVNEAQGEWQNKTDGKGAINPAWDSTDRLKDHTQIVEFDVAVTSENSKSGKGEAAIKILSAKFGAAGEIKSGDGTVSRLKFTIPIVPPVIVIHGGDVKQKSRVMITK